MTEPIPQPPPLPFLGNIRDVDPGNGLHSLRVLAEKYGEIYKLSILGRDTVIVSSQALCDEVCDDKRFRKAVTNALKEVRNGVGAGLFTAYHGEHDWEIAHRTLIPAFGPIPIKDMFDEMHDIASQLVLKWSRMGPEDKISVTDDYTRLTLDSIALCAMDTRFNSFYHAELHPFVQAMVDFLVESGLRLSRPAVVQYMMREASRKYQADIDLMKKVAGEVVSRRRQFPSDKKDLLNAMIKGKDPKTGEAMTDESIMNNMLTFLIAGHETTSGLLSFTTYYLLKHPSAYRKAQEEIDSVIGDGPVSYNQTSKLPYLQACLRESIRLQPTAPAFGREAADNSPEPCIIGGKYMIPKGTPIVCLLPQIQRDPRVYGDDAAEFRPERMLDDAFDKIPATAWKPFGTGPRACIGRPFAWQEAIMALAMILQNFDLRLVDPSYELRIKQTLTIKPDGMQIYAIRRGDHGPGQLEKRLFGGGISKKPTFIQSIAPAGSKKLGKPLTILFGGNTGTCQGLAQTLAAAADTHGYEATVSTLDSSVGRLPTDQPVVFITASFEGQPADNAGQFVEWVEHADANAFSKTRFSVFGCGHHDWASTYQRIPTLIDNTLADKGGQRICKRGESDVAMGTVIDDFDQWQDEVLWPALGAGTDESEGTSALDVELSTSSRVGALRQSVQEALVVKVEKLSGEGVSEKRMIQFKLSTGTTYASGDYLSILPMNSQNIVGRVLRRFGLPWDAEMTIKAGSHTAMPVGTPVSVSLMLSTYVELSAPASKKSIVAISKIAEDPKVKAAIESISTTGLNATSVLDILEKHPQLPVPFGLFLSMLPAMRIRQYSISSSPLVDPSTASITYHVLDIPIEGSEKHFLGVTTNYLKNLQVGDRALIAIKGSHYSFHLPQDNAKPVIMVCAGTGLAPFRAFVEERAAKIQSGQTLGKAMLFIGCAGPDNDRIYQRELEEWSKLGAVEVFYAYSRKPDASKGCKYAQDRVWEEREAAMKLFMEGAKVFVCGANRLGGGVKDISKKVFLTEAKELGKECSEEDAEKWFNDLKVQERWTSDIFD